MKKLLMQAIDKATKERNEYMLILIKAILERGRKVTQADMQLVEHYLMLP
jgi:hypothetical protein